MAFEAKIYRILIASPSDIGEERNIIPELINEWNALNALNSKVLLMPVKWETNSAPLLGNRPQAIINQQMVKDCDLLVGLFWTRIGTSTGVSISGTAEEIEQFVNLNKPVMLYFSQTPIEPEKIEAEQFTKLMAFKEKMRLKGLVEAYSGMPDFRQKFGRQLSININNILVQLQDSVSKETVESEEKKVIAKKTITQVAPKRSVIKPIDVLNEELTTEKIDEYLVKTVQSVAGKDGWASIHAVGHYLQTFTPINYHKLGFPKLKAFLVSRKLFEMKEAKRSPKAKNIDSAYVRLKAN